MLRYSTKWPADVDAWFGPATDGGFWALGLARPDGDLLRGVPMSRADTGRIQLKRLQDAGLRVRQLAALEDVDTFENAVSVANAAPNGKFARTLARMRRTWPMTPSVVLERHGRAMSISQVRHSNGERETSFGAGGSEPYARALLSNDGDVQHGAGDRTWRTDRR